MRYRILVGKMEHEHGAEDAKELLVCYNSSYDATDFGATKKPPREGDFSEKKPSHTTRIRQDNT